MARKCIFCRIIDNPQSYFGRIFYEDKICIIGARAGQDIMCVYSIHGELPGGSRLNEMMIRIGALMDRYKEYLQFVDHEHYRIYIRKKEKTK